MGRPFRFLLIVVLLVAALGAALVFTHRRGGEQVAAQLIASVDGETAGFAQVEGPRPFDFPIDYGPHPAYQTEWWYYTGNLTTSEGRRFGYQLTFFRRALIPPSAQADRLSDWAADQVYLAHFTLSDIGGSGFQAHERFSRGAAGLAGAQAAPYQVWLEDWSVEETGTGSYHLAAHDGDLSLDLTLVDRKGPVLQGDQGYSQKGPQPGDASYYYSLTRLTSSGTVQVGESEYAVDGLSWMDHEFSTTALAPDQVGWDWFSIQLDDGSELMLYELRRDDGTVDPYSSGTYVAPDGSTTPLSESDFALTVERTWRSPHSGATYPAGWAVDVPSLGLSLTVEPYLADQELNVSYTYWEGAVGVGGQHDGQPLSGSGYVELTGYAGSMQGQF
jgi:predicted secreted hydrolase